MKFINSSWPLFKALGVPVRIHISFLATLGFVILTNPTMLPIFLILVASIVVHEYGHVLAGRRFGNECQVIYLHLLGGAAMMWPSKSLREDWMVAIAGPLVSLGLALIFYTLHLLTGSYTLGMAGVLNLFIGVFNLAPIYPMDGGRIYKSFMEHFLGRQMGTKVAVWTAGVLAGCAAAYGLWSGRYFIVLLAASIIYFVMAEQSSLRKIGR